MISASFVLFTEINNHTVFDRILAPDEREDIDTVEFRRKQLNEAIDHIRAYPLLGVGLGNYKSYVNHSKGINILDPYRRIHFESTTDAPHSIFIQLISETGILGIIAFGLLLGYFLNHDLKVYRNKNSDEVLIFIIASWTIFLYGIMNPFNTVFLNSWFWFLRGIIHGYTYYLKLFKNLDISDK
jgi:O-antigen ligase